MYYQNRFVHINWREYPQKMSSYPYFPLSVCEYKTKFPEVVWKIVADFQEEFLFYILYICASNDSNLKQFGFESALGYIV